MSIYHYVYYEAHFSHCFFSLNNTMPSEKDLTKGWRHLQSIECLLSLSSSWSPPFGFPFTCIKLLLCRISVTKILLLLLRVSSLMLNLVWSSVSSFQNKKNVWFWVILRQHWYNWLYNSVARYRVNCYLFLFLSISIHVFNWWTS